MRSLEVKGIRFQTSRMVGKWRIKLTFFDISFLNQLFLRSLEVTRGHKEKKSNFEDFEKTLENRLNPHASGNS